MAYTLRISFAMCEPSKHHQKMAGAKMECHICTQATTSFARATVLRKYDIEYFRCGHCGFVQTEKPFWLSESYAHAIADTDLGPVNRAVEMSEKTKALVVSFFDSQGSFVDYGAGYGIFVRRMRDLGLNFYYYDKYCENIFARGFEATQSNGGMYELLTAFEVFEHLVEPLTEIETILKFSRNIFFTTELLPRACPKPNDWWYYGLDHGQHISFFSNKSLEMLAERFSLNLYSHGSFHLLTEKRLSERLYRLVLHSNFSSVVGNFLGSYRGVESLLPDDFARVSSGSSND